MTVTSRQKPAIDLSKQLSFCSAHKITVLKGSSGNGSQ